MRRKLIVVLLAAVSVPVFAASNLPRPWFLAGSDPEHYDASIQLTREARVVDLHSLPGSAGKFATAMQAFPAESYRGKRMRLSAQIKSYDVRGWAGLWMRIDGDGDPPQTLAFDNMQKRPIKGTTAWRTYEVVLDVAPTAKTVNFGFLLNGEGRVQATAFDLQPVNQRVKPTN